MNCTSSQCKTMVILEKNIFLSQVFDEMAYIHSMAFNSFEIFYKSPRLSTVFIFCLETWTILRQTDSSMRNLCFKYWIEFSLQMFDMFVMELQFWIQFFLKSVIY